MRVTRALYDNLKQGKGRKIVNITSVMGSIEMNFGGGYDYRASKVALNMLTNTLARELGKDGFISIVIHPGWVQTDMGGNAAPVTPEDSIRGMIAIIDGLESGSNGKFYEYTGKEMPW
jgi:NAD(P)-dependent dehydrogenase (short-subunit alcohol dehydrogenase family)